MTKSFYKVVYDGDLLPGHNQSEVQKKLATLLKLDEAAASRFFTGKTLTMKSKLELPQAKKYACALARFGVISYIIQEAAGPVEPASKPAKTESSKEGFAVTDALDTAAIKAYFDGLDEKQEEPQENIKHEVFSLDTFDKEVADMQKEDVELTGVHDVLDAEQIKNLLKKS